MVFGFPTDGIEFPGEGIVIEQQAKEISEQVKSQLLPEIQDMGSKLSNWVQPINAFAQLVSAILHKSSDYLHGVYFSYGQIDDELTGEEKITDITDILNRIKTMPSGDDVFRVIHNLGTETPVFKDLEEYGGSLGEGLGFLGQTLLDFVGSILKIITEILEFVIDLLTPAIALEHRAQAQIAYGQAMQKIGMLHALDGQMAQVRNAMFIQMVNISKAYSTLIPVKNTITDADRNLISSPDGLNSLSKKVSALTSEIERCNGNAFMMVRFLMAAIQTKKITKDGPTEAQLDNLSYQLFSLSEISKMFQSKEKLRDFVKKFFESKLFDDFSDVFSSNLPYLSSTPSQKQEFSDINNHKYDPDPSLSTDDIPLP
ncbi:MULTISPECIES: hypothetical protein [Aerosakkonema]|uniref:hypothetical protein n=1 Tax=Aerosakkonema TaxID=1246629 RepID=UPI0035B8AFD8